MFLKISKQLNKKCIDKSCKDKLFTTDRIFLSWETDRYLFANTIISERQMTNDC